MTFLCCRRYDRIFHQHVTNIDVAGDILQGFYKLVNWKRVIIWRATSKFGVTVMTGFYFGLGLVQFSNPDFGNRLRTQFFHRNHKLYFSCFGPNQYFQVEGHRPWVLCADFDFKGKAILLEPGEYGDLSKVFSNLVRSFIWLILNESTMHQKRSCNMLEYFFEIVF